MSSISPTAKYVESFQVSGLSVRTKNSDEFNEQTAKIPNLWQQFSTSGLVGNGSVYGVYSDFDSDANGPYTLTVGITSNEAQTQLSSVTIQAGNYLVFQNNGPMPAAVIETWKQIWNYFEINSEYQRCYISDFEAYTGPDQVSVYIGIK